MPGDAGDREDPAAEIELNYLVRPAGEAEEFLYRFHLTWHQRGTRPVGELRVTRDVIAVAMSVQNHKLIAGARVLSEPPPIRSSTVARSGNFSGSLVAPVSSSNARSLPKNRYRNGASKWTDLLWRRM